MHTKDLKRTAQTSVPEIPELKECKTCKQLVAVRVKTREKTSREEIHTGKPECYLSSA